ncbi:unnamed protein product [Knipowitschia caucasica]|uniref:UBX domain-containing protein 4 n=1 Tax=Knipowitschia caucasica TaxID=637954 RepID=A0AAV2JUU0_KNICA
MKWFKGSIPDAILEAKRRGRVFVVLITGDDPQSTELLSTWDEPRVTEAAEGCVAIKLDCKSEACTQFSQIYPVVCVPSSFFIGDSGIPLEVIASSISAEDLEKKIQAVKQMHQEQTAGGAVPQSSVQTLPQTPAAVTPETSAAPSSTETRPRSVQKAPESESKEQERRKSGKELQEIKRKHDDDQTKRLLEERQKEKEEERVARERVRQQIALDRAERAARYAQNVVEETAAKEARIQQQLQQQEEKKEEALRLRSSVSRLQFRLPDGSSISSQFPAQSPLREAQQFVQQEVGRSYGDFSMATMFPRREFTEEDLDRSLKDLELVPSASIVLLPGPSRSSSLASSSSSLWSLLGTLFCPLLTVWRMISSFVFGSSSTEASPSAAPTPAHSQSRDKPKNFKKDGKICRLRTQEDSEDENNTWNGNSTQQL